MAQIQIQRSGSTILTALIDDNSKLQKKLLSDDIINLKFSHDSFVEILIGDNITWNSRTYTVSEAPTFKKVSEVEYNYELTLTGSFYDLTNALYLLEGEGEFYLTGTAEDFLDHMITNLNRVHGAGTYSKGSAVSTDYKNLFFNNESCLQVLQRICKEFDIEYEFDSAGTEISLISEVGNSTGLSFEYKDGLRNIKRLKVGDTNLITRLYAYGAEKNITSDYGAKRLKLSSPGYIDNNTATYGVREGVKIFDDIYPHYSGTVDSVPANNQVVDAGIDFNLNDYLISGETAKIVFLTGDLAGMTFEISSYDNSTNTVTFKTYTDEFGEEWPSTSYNPSAGDEFTFVDIEMPSAYITSAESDLLTAAQDYLDEMSEPNVLYEIEMDWHNLKSGLVSLDVGDTITITDSQLAAGGVSLRILELTQSLANEYKYTVKVGQKVLINYFQKVAEAQKTIEKDVIVKKDDSDLLVRREYQRHLELQDSIFDPDGYFDTENIKPLSIETGMLTVGLKSAQLALKDVEFDISPGADNTKVDHTSGELVHYTIDDTGIKTWNISSGNITGLTAGTSYYVYARCAKSTTSADIQITETQYTVDPGESYYYFILGVLHGAIDGERAFSTLYGATSVSGRLIKTGRISSLDGLTYFDLDTGEISGQITFTSGSTGYSNIADRPEIYRIVAAGNSASSKPVAAGIYEEDNTSKETGGRSYNLVTYNRSTGAWGSHTTYDVFNDSSNALSLANALNALDSGDIFILYTYDEPQGNRWTNNLPEAIYRCGGSRGVFGSSDFKYRSAYILVGIGGIGEGNGIEAYSGEIDSSLDGWVEVTIIIKNGNLQLSPGMDKTKTVIDGGLITSGRIELGGDGSTENVNSGINGYGTAGTNVRFWAGTPWANAENASFKVLHNGKMFASEGEVAGWEIKKGMLISDTDAGTIEIDSDDLSFKIYDSLDVLRVSINNLSIPEIEALTDGSDGTYDGGYAYTNSDVSMTLTSNGDSDNDTYYLVYYSDIGGKYLDQDATDPGSSYYIKGYNDSTTSRVNLDGGNYYNIKLKINRKASTYFPDLEKELDSTPVDLQLDYESEVSVEGTFEYSYNVKLYASDGTELASHQVFSGSKDASDLSSTEILTAFNKKVFIPSGITSVYFKVTYTVDNYAYQQEIKTYYRYDGDSSTWQPTFPYTLVSNSSIDITYNFDINELVLDTEYAQTSIGSDGILTYWGDDKYFSINDSNANTAAAPFIESDGFFKHAGQLNLTYAPSGDVTGTELSGSALNINTNNSGYAMNIFNDGDNSNRSGIRMRIGADTPGTADNEYIWAEDGNGTTVGTLLNDSTSFRIYSVSDEREKEDIRDYETDALSKLSGFSPRVFKWSRDKQKVKSDHIGYISQEVMALIPEAVKNKHGVYMISDTALIPYLHKAIIELNNKLKKYETKR